MNSMLLASARCRTAAGEIPMSLSPKARETSARHCGSSSVRILAHPFASTPQARGQQRGGTNQAHGASRANRAARATSPASTSETVDSVWGRTPPAGTRSERGTQDLARLGLRKGSAKLNPARNLVAGDSPLTMEQDILGAALCRRYDAAADDVVTVRARGTVDGDFANARMASNGLFHFIRVNLEATTIDHETPSTADTDMSLRVHCAEVARTVEPALKALLGRRRIVEVARRRKRARDRNLTLLPSVHASPIGVDDLDPDAGQGSADRSQRLRRIRVGRDTDSPGLGRTVELAHKHAVAREEATIVVG